MIRFRFGLLPVHQIPPWGGEEPRLSWFGLTDGWYDIEVGGHELLRYSERTLRRLGGGSAGGGPSPYAEYFVVRLWEDVIEVVPRVMEPLDLDQPAAEEAADWHRRHALTMGHLRNPPYLRCWRTLADGEDVVTVAWEYEPDADVEFAAPAQGRVTMPTGSFVAAVTELDRALLAAMEQRVTELETAGPPPGVHIDLRHLRHEQQSRATDLPRAWERTCDTDWEAVRAGARALLGPDA